MINKKIKITLASKSPRRRKLLKQLNLNFSSISVDVDETINRLEKPYNAVRRIAEAKLKNAKIVVKHGVIITADTIVVLNRKVIGKPADVRNAFSILKSLSGKTHTVYTGYSLFNNANGKHISDYQKTKVTFRHLSDSEIREYVKSGSPMDKAGAYGIQDDFGAVFIDKINGCYYNVVGLPLAKLYHDLLKVIR